MENYLLSDEIRVDFADGNSVTFTAENKNFTPKTRFWWKELSFWRRVWLTIKVPEFLLVKCDVCGYEVYTQLYKKFHTCQRDMNHLT